MALTLIFASEGHNRRRRRRKQRFAIPHIFWPICGPQEASQQTPVCYDLPLNELQILSRKSEKNASNFFFPFDGLRKLSLGLASLTTTAQQKSDGSIPTPRADFAVDSTTTLEMGCSDVLFTLLSQPLQTMSFEVWE